MGKTLYAGLSTRTDAAGIAALSEIVRPIGFDVVHAKLKDCLHLKTAATLAGPGGAGSMTLIYNRESVDPAQFAGLEAVPVHEDEPAAANCLRLDDRLILPAGNPRTAELLRNRGLSVVEVDVSELQKAEAGVTCMSLIAD